MVHSELDEIWTDVNSGAEPNRRSREPWPVNFRKKRLMVYYFI